MVKVRTTVDEGAAAADHDDVVHVPMDSSRSVHVDVDDDVYPHKRNSEKAAVTMDRHQNVSVMEIVATGH
jgi:hypothetical protein